MKEYVTIEDLDAAYKSCLRRKGGSKDCMSYRMNYLQNNLQLYRELNDMSYTVGKSKAFCVTRPKLREVFCSPFRDRIVHHLLFNKFSGILEGDMIEDAYACRKGKGVKYGVERIRKQIVDVSRNFTKEAWILKCDLRGFFMSIDRNLMFRMLEDAVRSKYHKEDVEWWLWLWRQVVLNAPEKNCEKVGDVGLWKDLPPSKSLFTSDGKGLPIGNLSSQLLANHLLTPFDKHIKGLVGSEGGYGRYVDDFVVVSTDKKLLLDVLERSRAWLKLNLNLTLHPDKISLQRAKSGVRFIGTMIRPGRTYPNPRTVCRLFSSIEEWNSLSNPTNKEMGRYVRRVNSLMGDLVHHDSYSTRKKVWMCIKHKEKVYCLNMRCLKLKHGVSGSSF